ncbi:ABC-2 type transport system ATP-binding protein [Paenibacillus sp. yr247]|nr:ABC-2 type transport system ATP-binding protein [Paenibacillus sp. yr247]
MTSIRVEQLGKSFRLKKKEEGFMGSVRSLIRPEYEEKSAVEGIVLGPARRDACLSRAEWCR